MKAFFDQEKIRHQDLYPVGVRILTTYVLYKSFKEMWKNIFYIKEFMFDNIFSFQRPQKCPFVFRPPGSGSIIQDYESADPDP